MSAALSILLGHRYGTQGGAPAICLALDGKPTDCRWKARRGGDGYGIQHTRHLADLIDTAYTTDLLAAAQLQSVNDHVGDALAMNDALGGPNNEFQRGRMHAIKELAQILDFDEVRL